MLRKRSAVLLGLSEEDLVYVRRHRRKRTPSHQGDGYLLRLHSAQKPCSSPLR